MKEFDRLTSITALKLTDLQKSFAKRYVEHFNKARTERVATAVSAILSAVATFGRPIKTDAITVK